MLGNQYSVGAPDSAWDDTTGLAVHLESKHWGVETRPVPPREHRLTLDKLIGEVTVEFEYANFWYGDRDQAPLLAYCLDEGLWSKRALSIEWVSQQGEMVITTSDEFHVRPVSSENQNLALWIINPRYAAD